MNARIIAVALAFLAYTGVTRAAEAPELWHGCKVGMTVDEVLEAVPGSKPHSPAPGESIINGTELVEGPIQKIAGKSFLPEFYFDGSHLTQVTLGLRNKPNSYAAYLTFQEITDALQKKYGAELSLRKTSLGWDGEWTDGRSNISLVLISISGGTPILNIVYQTRVSGDEDKL